MEETRTGPDGTPYRLVTREGVSTARFEGTEILKVAPGALTALAEAAMRDCSFLLRPGHLAQWAAILDDPEASPNDRGVALTLLKNAEIAAHGVLPLCQDTGTAIVYAKKGEDVRTGGGDVAAIEEGIRRVYAKENLRYSQVAAVSIFEERNTGSNLPAQIEIEAVDGDSYEFLILAKGGGSANKFFLFQETKAVLAPDRLVPYLAEKMRTLGTAACPPYHVGIAVGGTSAEATLKTAKLATTGYLDRLPTVGDGTGRPFRDAGTEAALLVEAQKTGIGAQFGGKHFALDVRVVRLARHGASCPIALGVSCSAHRNVLARIDRDGVWLEALERDPGRFIPERYREAKDRSGVPIDLRRPMAEILAELRKHPVKTRLSLTGPMIVARDAAHAKIKERLDRGEPMPSYMKNHPIYYAGPAKTPAGMPSGSFGPTTAGRMDSYADQFMAAGGSLVTVAKGNRSKAFVEACRRHGGFYLGSIGGPAALIAQEHIRKVEVVEYPELGMEAVHRVEVEDFPVFVLVDDKGNDFFDVGAQGGI